MTRRVESNIRYLGPCSGKPAFYGRQRHLDNLPLENRSVRIEDLRSSAGSTGLDREGFALFQQATGVKDFFAGPSAQEAYLRESEDLVKQVTGAARVVASIGCVIRRSERSLRFGQDRTTVPGRFAHCDFSPNPAGSSFWVKKVLPPEEAEERLKRRFAIYNIWRILSEPPQDTALAVCDARSVGPHDAVCSDCVVDPADEPEFRFENSVFRHNPRHRWCYFSNMTPQEVLIFKGFDSDASCAGGIPHAAFDDPDCPCDAPPRESIDSRVIGFF